MQRPFGSLPRALATMGFGALGACVASQVPSSPYARRTATCPRDASRDASGRCACVQGTFPVLGACVPAAVGDAFCGPAAHIGAAGCVPRQCPTGEVIDVASGSCLAQVTLTRDDEATCAPGTSSLVESGKIVCVGVDATCPRGTRREGATCARPLPCPAGSLAEGTTCRPIVTSAEPGTAARVDVGAWASLVLGVDGGWGQLSLCSPLAQRPTAFEREPVSALTLNIRIELSVPDEDVSRVHATVAATDTAGRPLTPLAQALVRSAVDTQLEALRSLGGASSAGEVEVSVHCGPALPLR
jgi:hypothetical protein